MNMNKIVFQCLISCLFQGGILTISSTIGVFLNMFVMFIILIAKVKLPGHQVKLLMENWRRLTVTIYILRLAKKV